MPELSLLEIIKYSIKSLLDSKVFILLVLELTILLIAFVFSKIMSKKVVKNTSIIASLIVFGLYISNYVNTVVTFVNNVSTKFIELMYFPTTLEFVIVMVISIVIMFITLLNRKSKFLLKFINSAICITISFLFLCIIEYINVNNVPFDEFSVFTNPVLMSLYELAMGIFVSWLIGLIVYKIDLFIIDYINGNVDVPEKKENIVSVNYKEVEDIELPKLKNGVIK